MNTNFNRTGCRVIRKRVASLKPSPENKWAYGPIENDPTMDALTEAIRKNGLYENPKITEDNFIVSGHRRHEALQRIGQVFVTCEVLPIRRSSMTSDEFTVLLMEHNHYRHKTVADQVREELVKVNPDDAFGSLLNQQSKSVYAAEFNGVKMIEIEGCKKRFNLSEDKAEHIRLTKQVVFGKQDYWPLSVRGVHYRLLNFSFIRGYYWPRETDADFGHRRELYYRNDDGSYNATSDLITRLRLDGTIPWEAFDDFTRPLKEFNAFDNVQQFVSQEIRNLFKGYWRTLLQSQPNHIEVVCEKNTIYHLALRVTKKYHILTSSARGFNSADPWHDLHQRFLASGKKRLIVIMLCDWDPEGEMIPQVCGRTLRDDFGVHSVGIVKAGVTREQIDRYQLPLMNLAKDTSSNLKWFVERNNGDNAVYELEALDPEVLMNDLDDLIRRVIDVDLYNRELAREQEELPYLEEVSKRAMESLKEFVE